MSRESDKLAEIAARGAYASDGWWRHAGDNDDGKGRYKMHGDVRLRAVEWDQLDADEQEDYLQQARAALTALTTSGYAIVPVEPTEAMLDAGGSSVVYPSVLAEAIEQLRNLVGLAEMRGGNLHEYGAAIKDAKDLIARATQTQGGE